MVPLLVGSRQLCHPRYLKAPHKNVRCQPDGTELVSEVGCEGKGAHA